MKHNNELNSVVIADFGTACFAGSPSSSKNICGTDGPYLAPEVQLEFENDASGVVSKTLGVSRISFGIDIWCLGVISHILLCGCEPDFRKSGTDAADEIWGSSLTDYEEESDDEQGGDVSLRRASKSFDLSDMENQHKERGLSDDAKDFVASMIRLNQADRPSASDLIGHPFLKQ